MVSADKGLGNGSGEWFRVGVSSGIAVRCWLGLHSSESLTGAGGYIYRWLSHMAGKLVPTVHGESQFLYVGFSVGWLECPHNMVAGFS